MILLMLLFGLSITRAEIDTKILDYRADPSYECTYCQPEQIHISFGEKTNDIVVTWSTFNNTEESRVQYGISTMDLEATGAQKLFVDGGPMKRGQYIHKVILKDLKFNNRYVYHCGSKYGWSERFSFKTPPQGEDWVVRAAIYGDMGSENAHSLSFLQDEAERDHFDLILHVGDFAYDMHSDDGKVGDEFMRQIQPLAAIVPYMTCPGNHEQDYNFSNYRNRFSMPGEFESMFYSWDIGPIHFVSVNTEAYYYTKYYGLAPLTDLYYWLEEDLKNANDPKNRSKRPWIIIYGHRPMYCSNSDDTDCGFEYTRLGIPLLGLYSMEPLLKTYAVDLVIWAHEHSYERTWPLYDMKVYNGSYDHPYVNPGAPVHLVTGSAGCKEEHSNFKFHTSSWSAFHSQDYGYTKFKAYNKTHINIEQISVERDGQVIDAFWLIKTKENHTFDLP